MAINCIKTLPQRVKKASALALLATSFLALDAGTKGLSAEDYVLNFRDADIRAMIDNISMMTGRTFILDPQVRANVTIISREPVGKAAVFDLFLSALRVYGFAAIPTASGAYKIVPDGKAVLDSGLGDMNSQSDDVLISEIFRIDNVDPLTVLNTIKPLVNRQGRAIAHRTQNFILVVDFKGNMSRVRNIIAEIDRDNSVTRMITLTNVGAAEMAETLKSLRVRGEESAVDVSFSAIPVTSSNTLILKGQSAVLDTMEAIARDLDARGANNGGISVIYLRHASAEELAPILMKVSNGLSTVSRSGGSGGSGAQASQGGNRGASQRGSQTSIEFHAPTNSLIVSADPDVQKTIESVVRKLDIPRAQVLVEAIIVEVSDSAAQELGLQYILSGSNGSNIPFTATNFSQSAPNILAATGALALTENDVDATTLSSLQSTAVDSLIGISGFSAGFGGTIGDTLFGVIFNALETDTQSNILSTPYVMTLDNQPASLVSGQEIPVTTGESLGTANANAFRTVERIEVGIKLTVTPHINENGEIRMQIAQEVSSIFGAVADTSDLITNKRAVETTVIVEDGEVLVLGGLLEQNEQISLEKVPLLGDIPLLGKLFQSESESLSKTNLMVFIRPTIVRDGATGAAVTNRKLIVGQEASLPAPNGNTALDYILKDFTGAKPATTTGERPLTDRPD